MQAHDTRQPRKRVLDPAERISEVLFGLIMVLTFTGALSVAEAGRDDVRAMLIGAVGCNTAWGIIDAVLFLMGCLAEKNLDLAAYWAVVRAPDADTARRLLGSALPPLIASALHASELETMRQRLLEVPVPAERAHLGRNDWLGALAVFLLVFTSTLPVLLPFLFMSHAGPALRVSNTIAVAMLYLAGHAYGRAVGRSPALVGLTMVLLGAALVFLTVALGG